MKDSDGTPMITEEEFPDQDLWREAVHDLYMRHNEQVEALTAKVACGSRETDPRSLMSFCGAKGFEQ